MMTDNLKREEFGDDLLALLDDTVNYGRFLQYLKENILEENEYQDITDKKGNTVNFFLKKSGYYKLKRAFKVRIELVDWGFTENDKGSLKWAWFLVKATKGDESMEAIGSCDKIERGKNSSNDVLGTAHTRAIVRGISQLVDFGSVSADEISNLEVSQSWNR